MLKTVPYVDLQKYQGLWYEIASIPQFFSPIGTTNTTAMYKINNGYVDVINKSCFNGQNLQIYGKAISTDSSNSKLKVDFGNGRMGDYWIIILDKNYLYSVVTDPSKNTLFILSRTKNIDPSLLQKLLLILFYNFSFDVSKVIITPHNSYC